MNNDRGGFCLQANNRYRARLLTSADIAAHAYMAQ